MNTAPAMNLVAASPSINAADLAASHTVAFVTLLRACGTISVRYSGPESSGVASFPWDTPLFRIVRILRDASGLRFAEDAALDTVATFVPASGSTASTVDEIHAEHVYTVFVRSTPR